MPWDNNRPTHVPAAVRDACLTRDGNQCVAQLNDGTRCSETQNLQAAHHNRWTPGERTTINDVRTLCHWHHNRETQQEAANARRNTWRPSPYHPREKHPARR